MSPRISPPHGPSQSAALNGYVGGGKPSEGGGVEWEEKAGGERWRAIVQSVSDLIAEVDQDGKYTFLSPNHREALGRDPATLIGKPAFLFVHPEHREQATQTFGALRAGEQAALEMRIQHASGEWRWFECVVRVREDEDGRRFWVSAARDVSEKRKGSHERALREKLSQIVNRQESLGAVARALSVFLKPLLPFDLFFISLLEADEIRLAASDSDPDSNRDEITFRVPRCSWHPTWELLENGRILVNNDFSDEEHTAWLRDLGFPNEIIEQSIQERAENDPNTGPRTNRRTRAFLNVPLRFEETLVGILHFDSLSPHVFAPEHEWLAVSVAESIAGSLHRLQSLEATRTTQRRLSELIAQVDAIVWEADASTDAMTFVSPQVREWVGCEPQEWLGPYTTHFARWIHPDDRDRVLSDCAALTLLGQDHTLEFRLLKTPAPDSSQVLGEDASVPPQVLEDVIWVRDIISVDVRDGTPVRLHGLMLNISERKRDLDLLHQNEEKFRAIFESALDAILILDGDGCLLEVNRSASELLGASPTELEGRCLRDFVEEDAQEVFAKRWRKYLKGGAARGEFRLKRDDGTRRELEFMARAHFLPGRHLAVVRDITARKRQDQESAMLLALAQAINAQSEPQILVASLAAHLAPLVPFDVLFLSRLQGESLCAVATYPPGHAKARFEMLRSAPHVSRFDPLLWGALERGEAYLNNNANFAAPSHQAAETLGEPQAESRDETFLTRSFINVPLLAGGEMLGVLHVDSSQSGSFTFEHLRLMRLVGEQLAIAIRQADLLAQARRAEAEAREASAVLEATQEAAADGIFLVDESGAVVSCNRRFAQMWQVPDSVVDELRARQGLMYYILSMMADPDEFLERISFLVDNPDASTRDEVRLKDGRVFERYSAPAVAPGGKTHGRVWSFSDITERKQTERQLRHQAFHDPLTGLPNRAFFMDSLGRVLGRARRTEETSAVLFLDLDRFKIINDSLGHETGDQLLIEASRRLKNCLRPGDLAARFGGDEFTVLLEDVTSITDATHVAERIAEVLSTPFDLSGHEVYTTTSVGIVLSHKGTDRAEDLLRDADVAMYRAKNKGRARYEIFDSEMSAQAFERLRTEIDLRQALKRNELRLFYQPLVELSSGRIVGAEALVRWQHPERGLVFPGDFIELAEESGIIFALGGWVLRHACEQAREWSAKYFCLPEQKFHVSVNISAKQFHGINLAEEIGRILNESALDPARLNLEITESVMLSGGSLVLKVLSSLRKLGVRLSIDDFGTGFSSLAYLKQFPLDTLKIDRSFISGPDDAPAEQSQNMAIVQAVHGLGLALGMNVVAEGVETREQLESLRNLGCDIGQGYFFARPLPPQQFEDLLKSGHVW